MSWQPIQSEDSPYLFPFLEGMKTGEDAYKEYNTVLGGFNRRLKILSESIGIHTRLPHTRFVTLSPRP